MPSEGAALDLVSLTKSFGPDVPPSVDAIDLAVQPGEFVTLLGPSGSGKSTTLNMIAGFTDVTSGQILVNGNDISRTPAYRRNMGVVFQNYALFPHMTAAENIAFGLQQRGVAKDEIKRRVDEALHLVQLESLGDRRPKNLSGGQQQRVAVARALVIDPQVLLMDEPLGALDKRLREQVQVEIGRLHRSLGLTFIFVTHDQDEALSLSDRIAVFNAGRIEQVGTAADLYERPQTLFVAEFVGESTVFRGILNGSMLETGSGAWPVDPGNGIPDGAPAALVVRPERMRVVPEPDGLADGETGVRATVTDLAYLGASWKTILQMDSGGSCLVRGPRDTGARPGDSVLVAWSIEDGVVVPNPAPAMAAVEA